MTKLTRAQQAAGYWSNPHRYMLGAQVPQKVRVLLQDKLITAGRRVGLWTPVTSATRVTTTTSGIVPCTCVKDTTDSGERSCLTCHGAKFAPGLLKFGHQTHFWCSSEAGTTDNRLTLAHCEVSHTKKVNIITLSDGQSTGSITFTATLPLNPTLTPWHFRLDGFKRSEGASVVLDYSLDSGTTWVTPTLTAPLPGSSWGYSGSLDAADLLVITDPLDPDYTTAASVTFRITLTRASATVLSPAFEIFRLRRTMPEHLGRELVRQRKDVLPGEILLARTQVNEQDMLDALRGRITEHLSDHMWTSPLDFFDTSITPETPSARIADAFGPHPFYEYTGGVQEGTRYVLTQGTYNEQFGIFTHQGFNARRTQEGEPYWQVF